MGSKLIILFLLISSFSFGQLAFENAEGYGKNATGGKGGTIYKVVNKNNTGVGSLRYGMETLTGPRTILFYVSGYIDITTPLKIRDGYGNVTIAGETSPEGICIRGASLWIEDDNVIIRHLKIRPGEDAYNPSGLPPSDPDYEPDDALRIVAWPGEGGVQNIMLDHIELTWGHDGMIDMGGSVTVECKNISLTNSLIAENVDKGYATLSSPGFNITMAKNVWYSFTDRTPAISSKDAEGVEYINNYHFYTTRAAWFRRGNRVDFINNVYETGALTRSFETFRMEAEYNTNIANTRIYLDGNLDDGVDADTNYNASAAPYIEATPYHGTGVSLIATALVKDSLVDYVGTKFYDAVTTRIMNNIKNGTGSFVTDEANVGGYPVLGTMARDGSYDTDNDGMADDWEVARWGNLTNSNNGDDDTDGYTNLQEFLMFMADDNPAPVEVDNTVLSTKRINNAILLGN